MISKFDEKKIINSNEITLSSSRTFITEIIFPILFIPYIYICYYLFVLKAPEEFKSNHYFALGVAILGMMFFLYMYSKIHTAKLVGSKLVFKKIISKQQEVNVNNIIKVRPFRIKFNTYLSIKFYFNNRKKTIWIMKPSSFTSESDSKLLVNYARLYYSKK